MLHPSKHGRNLKNLLSPLMSNLISPADVNSSSDGLEERPPKDKRRLLPFSHLEHHKVDGDDVVSDLHEHIQDDAQRIANRVVVTP
jgi:hypothetical protein